MIILYYLQNHYLLTISETCWSPWYIPACTTNFGENRRNFNVDIGERIIKSKREGTATEKDGFAVLYFQETLSIYVFLAYSSNPVNSILHIFQKQRGFFIKQQYYRKSFHQREVENRLTKKQNKNKPKSKTSNRSLFQQSQKPRLWEGEHILAADEVISSKWPQQQWGQVQFMPQLSVLCNPAADDTSFLLRMHELCCWPHYWNCTHPVNAKNFSTNYETWQDRAHLEQK